jgi:hypothetical protein
MNKGSYKNFLVAATLTINCYGYSFQPSTGLAPVNVLPYMTRCSFFPVYIPGLLKEWAKILRHSIKNVKLFP